MKYIIKCDKTDIVLKNRKFTCGERYVHKSKSYDRYYVLSSAYSYDDDIELFMTDDFEKAKEILALTQEVWSTHFYIIGFSEAKSLEEVLLWQEYIQESGTVSNLDHQLI